MFEKATRLKLRFDSVIGYLSVEDLWDLSLQQLNSLAKKINKQVKETKEEDFLEEISDEDAIFQLKFNIVLHVLETKKKELKEKKEESLRKEEREKILGILSKKQDAALEELSEKDLLKKLDELS